MLLSQCLFGQRQLLKCLGPSQGRTIESLLNALTSQRLPRVLFTQSTLLMGAPCYVADEALAPIETPRQLGFAGSSRLWVLRNQKE